MENSSGDRELIESALRKGDFTYIVASDAEELAKEFCAQCGFNIGTHQKPIIIDSANAMYVDYEKIGMDLENDYSLYNDCVYVRLD